MSDSKNFEVIMGVAERLSVSPGRSYRTQDERETLVPTSKTSPKLIFRFPTFGGLDPFVLVMF